VQRDDGSVGAVQGQAGGFIPAERHRGRYANAVVPRRENALKPIVGKPALLRTIDTLPPLRPGGGTPDRDVRDRLEMLLGVDESTAQLVQLLRDLGELDNTIFVFTSDHGYFYGEHGLNEERRLAYEETARIPLIIRYPRVARAGATPEPMVQTIDLAPTLLELAGVADTVKRHGVSLVPALNGTATNWRTSILLEYYSDVVFPRMLKMGYQAVRTERYKYIHYVDLQGMDELYDLQTDPFELDNLIDTERGRALLPELQAELTRLLRETAFPGEPPRIALPGPRPQQPEGPKRLTDRLVGAAQLR
jgi:N-acetylglucosamine-6-sulfatase